MRQRSFERKSWYHPPSHNFSDKRKFLKIEGFPYKILRYCERINFRQSRDTLSYAIFLIQKFSGKRVRLGMFSVLWDKKVSRKSRDFPLLSIKIFDKRIFLIKKGFPYETFRCCKKINFRQNRDTQSFAISLFQKISEKKVLLGIFSVLWDKKISRENRDNAFLSIKIFDKRNFWKKKGSPTKVFGTVRKSIFDEIVIHHLMHFFYSRKFLKKRVLLGALPVLWDKKVSRESRDIPLLAIKISDKRKFLKDEGFPYKILRYCERINFRQSRDTPLMQFS